jgi:S-adenosylmethionine/arginine decarboxylase-like enzyme
MNDFNHLHVVISATVRNPPRTVAAMDAWLLETVAAVNMKVLMGPFSTRCETAGNVGVTGIVVIETSHLSCHCWEEASEPFMNVDLYSCATFKPDDVVQTIRKHFDASAVTVLFIDRNDNEAVPHVIEEYIETFPLPVKKLSFWDALAERMSQGLWAMWDL